MADFTASEKKVRVLHVLGSLNAGGTETWLMHVLRHIDRQRFHMDFLVHTAQPGTYDAEARALGSLVLPCLSPQRPRLYARAFRRICREHGPYDVVHSHVHHFSGCVMRLAYQLGVPVRVAHSHSDTRQIDAQSGHARRVYTALMRRWLSRYATCGLAASGEAAAALFGPGSGGRPPWRVLYCAIDLDRFVAPIDGAALRARLGIPADAFVIGHVGGFGYPKNHRFVIDIAAEARRLRPRTHLLLVGDGPLRGEIEQHVAHAGLAESTLLTGRRDDVPDLMRSCMDVLVLPSHFEGLPLVALEAQAAGLPVFLSDAITREADVVPQLIRRLSLSQPAAEWAAAVLAAPSPADATRRVALAALRESPFAIGHGVAALEQAYRGGGGC